MAAPDAEFFQKSHAKYYVGVFESHVEVLSGSFNIHTGSYVENMTFKKYDRAFFKERYLHMFPKFEYSDPEDDENVHYMTLGVESPKNFTIGLKDLLKMIDDEPS